MSALLSEEELEALRVLSRNHRLVIILAPQDASQDFLKSLSRWVNAALDSGTLPPPPRTDA